MYMLIHGYNDMVFATAHYFDDRDPVAETEAWQTGSTSSRSDQRTVAGRGEILKRSSR